MSKVAKNMTRVNLGFDIGIASVGWSVLDNQTGKILETGVSIFPSGSASRNEERRSFRQSRRLIRRKKARICDMDHFLKKNGFPFPGNTGANPYEIRVKGLTEKLSREEVAIALHHLVKRRGISYDLKDVEDESASGTNYQESIAVNQRLLKKETPAEIQLARLTECGKVRGQVKSLGEDNTATTLLNVFPNAAYQEEMVKLLKKQQEFYGEIDDPFMETAIGILSRKREYFIGPGSEKSRTDYGIYRTDGTTLKNLFEILVGKDKIFPDQYRAAGNSYTAQLYNLLNDLNNLEVDATEDGKLTTAHKEQIIEELTTTTGNVNMLKLIAKVAGTSPAGIKKYRVDREGKPEFHSLAIYRRLRKKLGEAGFEINEWPPEFFDDYGPIVTLNTESGELRKWLAEEGSRKYDFLTEPVIEAILANKSAFDSVGKNKWHRFSLKTMQLLIPELLHTSKEQMTILAEMGLLHENKKDYGDQNKVDVKYLTENLYNPVVRKSVKQAMDIFNALFEKYANIDYVVIEMPRDDAEDEQEQKKQFQKFQLKNEKEKDASLKEFQELAGVSDLQLEAQLRKRKKLRQKIRMWYQQRGKCPYSGKTIAAVDLFHQDNQFEIDHIIPLSVSFDDGQNNKVLCYSEMNQEKGKQTPYAFMSRGGGQGFSALQAYVKSNNRLENAKKRNLLFTEDINDLEVRKRFIARNLVDTRYASRIVLNELQQFVRGKKLDTRVTVIRGKLTSKLRDRWRLNKSRETHHHHAIDAAVIAVSPMLKMWEKNAEIIPLKVDENTVDLKSGEIITDQEYAAQMYELPYARFLEQMPELHKKIKFHHQVDKKMNRKVSDATLYSTRKAKVGTDKKEQEYVIGKIKDIYQFDQYKKFKKLYDADKSKFLMQRLDPQTFTKLEQIMEEYPGKIDATQPNGTIKLVDISPFELYRREHGPVTKYAKKNNGPAIKSLKFYDSKVGFPIKITPKNAKGKEVILQSLKPWRTDVYYNHEKQQYEIMGIKYADLKFKGDNYGITKVRYQEIKEEEGVSEESEFLFSLYRGDRVRIINESSKQDLLFGSRTKPAQKGYVELKPINKSRFEGKEIVGFYGAVTPNGQFVKRFLPKGYVLLKVNTDILGNPFYIKKESDQPKNILDL